MKSRYYVNCYVIYRNEAIIKLLKYFHIFKFSRIEVLPSLNEIASTGLDLDLYCNISRPNNPKKMTQDVNVDDFIFENSLFY